MSLLSEIDAILSRNPSVEKPVYSGNNINPRHIPWLTENLPELDLGFEDLVIASYIYDSAFFFLLTNKFLYFSKQEFKTRIPFNEIDKDTLEGKISSGHMNVILGVIELLKTKKQNIRSTLGKFLDDFSHVSENQNYNFGNSNLFFDGKYLEMLSHESDELLKMCGSLNQDEVFIHNLNIIFNNTGEAAAGIKAEHLIIADLVKAYNLVCLNENEKSIFTLAYFFERLQGNNFSKGITTERLNKLVTIENFRKNIEKIKSSQIINISPEYQDEFLLPLILLRIENAYFTRSGNLIYRFASLIAKADGSVNDAEKEALRKILVKTGSPKTQKNISGNNEIPDGDTLEKVLFELNTLVGLEDVKKSILDLVNLIKVEKIRHEKNLKNPEISLHSVFLGPPGTGKTTVARLLGRIYKHLGYLEKGHLIETDRSGLVAGYVGQTALKVNELIQNSLGGVLFIDEAYSLAVEDGGRDFGKEAIDVLVKRMEDLRNKFVVVVAGYTEPLTYFIESNPGLRSRFNKVFMFNHFLPAQLLQIMNLYCGSADFTLSVNASEKLLESFEMLYEKRDEGFGNARVVRNIFEHCIQNQANRLVNIPDLTNLLLQTIEEEDVPEPKYLLEQVYFTNSKN